MQCHLFFVFILSLLYFTVQQIYDPNLPVWPYPYHYAPGPNGKRYLISNYKDFEFISTKSHPIIHEAIQRYKKLTFWDDSIPSSTCHNCVKGLKIIIDDITSEKPTIDMNESYGLILDAKNEYFELRANQIWGALRGLETFSQIVELDDENRVYFIGHEPAVIADKPRFKWRGFMIDTSRHYLPVKLILKILDGMSYDKFNVLHWHVTDAESFPMVVNKYPLLHQKGAWTPKQIYTHEDIKQVVQYATKLGIRVIPEFDVPGHTYSWGKGYPSVVAKCPQYNINSVPLNPSVDLAFDLIDAVLSDSAKLMDDEYIHIGGDEVVKGCWASDKSVVDFMNKKGWGNNWDKLLAYFENKLEPIYRKYNKKMICWEDLILKQKEFALPKDAVVQVWMNQSHLVDIVKRGHNAILSAGWYLSFQKPVGKHVKDRLLFYDTWMDYYTDEPYNIHPFTDKEKELIWGGEACQWGEQLDPTVYEGQTWPRLSAVAERLWSPIHINDTSKAFPRLQRHRCNVFVKRGIGATPLRPQYCPYSEKLWNYN